MSVESSLLPVGIGTNSSLPNTVTKLGKNNLLILCTFPEMEQQREMESIGLSKLISSKIKDEKEKKEKGSETMNVCTKQENIGEFEDSIPLDLSEF